jgi:hypothetical protein
MKFMLFVLPTVPANLKGAKASAADRPEQRTLSGGPRNEPNGINAELW